MVSTLSSVSSSRRRARSVRTRSTKSAGLMFKPARNRRLSERCDTPACAASASVRQSARGCAVTRSASFATLLLPADCAASSAENWLWPARPDAEYDMAPRNCERKLAAEVGLDHRQGQIHAGGHARRGPDTTILDMDGIALDAHGGTKPLQRVDLAPMRGRAPAVERSGSREEKRAAAHRGDARHPADRAATRCRVAPPCASSCRMPGSPPTVDQRVGAREAAVGDLRVGQVGDEPDAGRGREGSGLRRCDRDAIDRTSELVFGARKHLQRAGDVEQLAVRKREHQNVVRGRHGATSSSARDLF